MTEVEARALAKQHPGVYVAKRRTGRWYFFAQIHSQFGFKARYASKSLERALTLRNQLLVDYSKKVAS